MIMLMSLAQIYPTDQSVSSYSSNPSTPVSSPPPLTGSAPGWAPGAAPVSPHFTADPNRGTIHMVCIEILFKFDGEKKRTFFLNLIRSARKMIFQYCIFSRLTLYFYRDFLF